MHDILVLIPLPFTESALPIHSYGVMAMIGFLAALLVARWRAKRVDLSPDSITDVALWALLCGIVGARAVYVAQNASWFFDANRPDQSLLDVLKIWQGGLVYYGGFIGAAIAVVVVARIRKEKLLPVLDVLAPSLALGHAFGRIGCFLRGCCWGVPVAEEAWYGVVFPDSAPAHDVLLDNCVAPGTKLFPVQLVNSLNLFVIFAVLSLFFSHRRGAGQVTALYLMIYSIHRFSMEFLRGDTRLPGELSMAQWISICTFFAGLALLAHAAGRSGKPSQHNSPV